MICVSVGKPRGREGTLVVVHVNSWSEFAALASKHSVDSVVYSTVTAPLSKPPIGLRVFFIAEMNQYVFNDYAEGPVLKKTGVAVRDYDKSTARLDEGEVRSFLRSHLGGRVGLVSADILVGM